MSMRSHVCHQNLEKTNDGSSFSERDMIVKEPATPLDLFPREVVEDAVGNLCKVP